MVGADATATVGPVEINAQVVHREDNNPTFTPGEPTVDVDGGFVEVVLRPARSRWYGIGLYNRVDASAPLLDVRLGGPANVTRYQTFTVGGGYVWRRNVRALAELTWDSEAEEAALTLGLVTAF